MASETGLNGTGSTGDLTPAQRLMEKHTADDGHSHNVTLEEVVDEDDVEHPPPSGISAPTATSTSTMSEKAFGKKPETSKPTPKPNALDTQSEELFPALGAPKSQASAAPSPWSRKPPAVSTNGMSNGAANGYANAPSSKSSTPMVTPGSTVPSQRGQISLPGRHTERVQFAPSQITPRNQLKKPVLDTLRDINKRSKAEVKMSTGPGGVYIFEGTGPVEAVRQALKEVAKELGSKV